MSLSPDACCIIGAQYASGAIAQAGEKLQQRVAPNAQPYVLDPKTKDRYAAHMPVSVLMPVSA